MDEIIEEMRQEIQALKERVTRLEGGQPLKTQEGFEDACESGDAELVQEILIEGDGLIKYNLQAGLNIAARQGHLDIIQNIGHRFIYLEWNLTEMLHKACAGGHLHIVEYLYSKRKLSIASIDPHLLYPYSPIHIIKFLHSCNEFHYGCGSEFSKWILYAKQDRDAILDIALNDPKMRFIENPKEIQTILWNATADQARHIIEHKNINVHNLDISTLARKPSVFNAIKDIIISQKIQAIQDIFTLLPTTFYQQLQLILGSIY